MWHPHPLGNDSGFKSSLCREDEILDSHKLTLWINYKKGKERFIKHRSSLVLLLSFFVLQAILEEHKEAEVELIRHRMSRVSHNMPDTLYMVGPSQKRSNTAPALYFQAAAASRLELDERPSTAQSSNKADNELDRYVRNRRTSEVALGMRFLYPHAAIARAFCVCVTPTGLRQEKCYL